MFNTATDFKSIDSILLEAGAIVRAAEAHGLQSGIICGETSPGSFDWRSVLLRELDCRDGLPVMLQVRLDELHKHTARQLHSLDFDFELLLPDDSQSLDYRTKELSNWCRGFLCGLGLAGIDSALVKSEIAQEAILDLSNIAHVDADVTDSEENELAFMELIEYVRVAVQAIKVELQAPIKVSVKRSNLH